MYKSNTEASGCGSPGRAKALPIQRLFTTKNISGYGELVTIIRQNHLLIAKQGICTAEGYNQRSSCHSACHVLPKVRLRTANLPPQVCDTIAAFSGQLGVAHVRLQRSGWGLAQTALTSSTDMGFSDSPRYHQG